MEPTRLCEIATRYGCDKTPSVFHSYTPFYDDLLRTKNVQRVLEIGVFHGASLHMWREYFPQAQIFGFDVNPHYLFQEKRIETYLCDATNREQLAATVKAIGGDFDLIIDDGDHIPEHQLLAAEVLVPYLASNGVYVIEDIEDDGKLSALLSFPHHVYRFEYILPYRDNCLIVIEEGEIRQ